MIYLLCVTVNTLLCRFALVSCLGVGLLVHFQCEMVGSGLNYGMCSSNQFKICIKTFNFNASDSCLNVRLLVHFLCEMIGSWLNYVVCGGNQFKICIETFDKYFPVS